MALLDEFARFRFTFADAPARACCRVLADTELFAALVAEPLTRTPPSCKASIWMRAFLRWHATARIEWLADFNGGPVAYLAMPGACWRRRWLMRAGLLVNPGHPSQMMLDAGHAALADRGFGRAAQHGQRRSAPPSAADARRRCLSCRNRWRSGWRI